MTSQRLHNISEQKRLWAFGEIAKYILRHSAVAVTRESVLSTINSSLVCWFRSATYVTHARDFVERCANILNSLVEDRKKQRSTCSKSTREQSLHLSMMLHDYQSNVKPSGVKVHTVVFKVFEVAYLRMATDLRFGDVLGQDWIFRGFRALWKRKIIPKKTT